MLIRFNKALLILGVIIAVSALSCSRYVDRDFLKEEDGVIVGNPIRQNDATWFLPVAFKTRITHSAQYIDGVKVDIKDNTVRIKARVALVKSGSKPVIFTGADLGKLADGTYQIKYLNKDGSMADVSVIEIKN